MTGSEGADERMQAMLHQAFTHLGAPPEQARTMAAQLLKRARQLAAERGIAESTAMAELLAKVIAGRKGEYTGQPPPDRPESRE